MMNNIYETELAVQNQPTLLPADSPLVQTGSAVAIILAVAILLKAMAELVKVCQE